MKTQFEAALADEAATEALGQRLALALRPGDVVHLRGELGAGKTTLVRGVLRALGHTGAVKSPTYTLVESYETPAYRLHHFDLYRLRDPLELEELGIRDYLDGEAVLLIEWPERGASTAPPPDALIELSVIAPARCVRASAANARGAALIAALR